MTRILIPLVCLAALFVPSAHAGAQGITQQQADEILKELRAIRELLQNMQPPAAAPPGAPPADEHVTVPPVTGYMLGRPDAPLTMIEFTDLQCPFCSRFATTTFELLKTQWIDTGRLRFVSRDFPLAFHPQAMPAARAARCAGEQGRFWELRTALVRNADKLSPDYITGAARSLDLDMAAFAACTASDRHDAEIAKDQQLAAALGISGTPTFVVGRTTNEAMDGVKIVGAQPYALFEQKLKALAAGPPGR